MCEKYLRTHDLSKSQKNHSLTFSELKNRKSTEQTFYKLLTVREYLLAMIEKSRRLANC